MKNLKYSSMILIRIHWNIIIQEATKIFWVLNAISHDHLDHGLSKIFSWIIKHFSKATITMNFVPSPLWILLSTCLASCLSLIIWSSLSCTMACARLEIDANLSEFELSASSDEDTLSRQLQHKALHPLCWSCGFLLYCLDAFILRHELEALKENLFKHNHLCTIGK